MKQSAVSVTTRVASQKELAHLLQWAADEGWNPGVDDASLFHATDATGYFVSYVNNELAAGISLVKHSDHHAFLGLYLCNPQFRGQGVGLATWNAGLASVGDRCIGLDGVVDQQNNYRKSGFVYRFGNMRYCGVLDGSTISGLNQSINSDLQIKPASDEDFAELVKYDASIGGIERPAFLKAWMASCDTRQTFIALNDASAVGIAGVRACVDGFKVGPMLADSENIAAQLMNAVSRMTGDASVMLDVPQLNGAAVSFAERLMLKPIFETARMYKGQAPEIDVQRLFGVATLELG